VVDTTTDAGHSWTTHRLPVAVQGVGGISCPTDTHCVTVAYGANNTSVMLFTTNAGRTWNSAVLPTGLEGLDGPVACPSAALCWAPTAVDEALGVGLVTSTDGGRTWAALPGAELSGYSTDGDITCPTASDCWIGADNSDPSAYGGVTEIGGQPTSGTGLPPSNIEAIACATPLDCFAAGYTHQGYGPGTSSPLEVFATTDGGNSWTTQALPATTGAVNAMACPTPSRCWAATDAGMVTTDDGGTTWTVAALPPAVQSLEDVTCPRGPACAAVGFTSSSVVILGL
jgi:photosystem II stability/assembly factor-like uncharacterized protein